MKTIVIYHSQTGFTERYARWIAEAAGAECVSYGQARRMDLDGYDAIVFGGWALAGSVSKLPWFRKHIPGWKGKKLIVFCVGASPADNPEIAQTIPRSFSEEELRTVRWFYCPGGLDYARMSAASRTAMRLFVGMLRARKDKTEAEWEQIRMLSSSYDIADKGYIEPILACLEGAEGE